MAASVATGSPLPESGVLQGSADANVDALIEQSRQLAATPLGDVAIDEVRGGVEDVRQRLHGGILAAISDRGRPW